VRNEQPTADNVFFPAALAFFQRAPAAAAIFARAAALILRLAFLTGFAAAGVCREIHFQPTKGFYREGNQGHKGWKPSSLLRLLLWVFHCLAPSRDLGFLLPVVRLRFASVFVPHCGTSPRQVAATRARLLASAAILAGFVLPDKGDEPIAGAPAVFGIAGQLPAEDFFLVEQAENDGRDDEDTDRHGGIRTECQGCAEPDDDAG